MTYENGIRLQGVHIERKNGTNIVTDSIPQLLIFNK